MNSGKPGKLNIIYAVILLAVLTAGSVFMYASFILNGGASQLISKGDSREEAVNERIPQRPAALMPYQFVNSFFGRKYYPDNRYLIRNDGQIIMGSEELYKPETVEGIRRLYDFCRSEDRDFLYAVAPGKPVDDMDLKEYGISCYRNESADLLMEKLEKENIPALDLRPVIYSAASEQGNRYSMFYKSDHHWTADGGLIAAGRIADELNDRYDTGLDTDAIAEKNMRREVIDEPFIGETGAKLLGPFGSSDHLVIWRPVSDPVLHYRSINSEIDRTGGFDVLFDKSRLNKDMISDGKNLYYYYMGNNDNLAYVENKNGGDSSILFISDSFSCVVSPFLALTTGKLTLWNMREDNKVLTYIKEHPEIKTVVIMYTISFTVDQDMNDFR